MDNQLSIKVREKDIIFFLLAVIFCTVFRLSLLFIYPLLVVFLFYYLNWRISRLGLFTLLFVFLCWILSFRHGFYLKYNLVSFFYYIPFLLLVMAVPHSRQQEKYLERFIGALTVLAIINNIIGIIQYIRFPNDDSFRGLYGTFTVSQNGLSILNGILFFYYLQLSLQTKKLRHIWLCIFFIICCVLGFYGAGMVVFVVSVALSYLKPTLKNIIKFSLVAGVSILAVYFLLKTIRPDTLQYNVNIINRFRDANVASGDAPRKLIVFRNYVDAYSSNPFDLAFGSGPGTFNSRSAFMVGSPSYFQFDIVKSDSQPFYFANYAYPLWNPAVIRWYDGFMSQPFTSILACLGEYGIIISLLVFSLIIMQYRRVQRYVRRAGPGEQTNIAFRMNKFLTIFMILLIVIDNYVEYPETLALLLILVKLCEGKIIANRELKSMT